METPEEENRGDLANVQAKEEEDTDKDKQLESKEDSAESHGEDEEESLQPDGSKKESTTGEIQKLGSSLKDPLTPSERPSRERKIVKRYTESSTSRGSTTKPLLIDQGRGTQLKDIPNVAFKLSKRKPDDNLQILHSIMFGKRTKAHNLKKNLGMFSGYMWVESEHEKQRGKVKEKLDKCVKEKLMDFCDVLNIPINKATTKKEDLCTKLLEFLECPHATTENLLSDKEKKGSKRKGKPTGVKTTGPAEAVTETPTKKQKKVGGKRKRSSKTEDEDNGDDVQDDHGDHDADADVDESDTDVESDDESKPEPKPEPEEDESKSSMPTEQKSVKEDSPTKSTKKSSNKTSSSRTKKNKVEEEGEKDQNVEAKEKKSRKKQSSTKKPKAEEDEEESKKDQAKSTKKRQPSNKIKDESDKKASTKKKNSKKEKVEAEIAKKPSLSAKEKTSNKNQPSTSSTKVLENDPEKGKKEPSKEEMHAVSVDILKEVDFNIATLADIIKQLGTHFGVDLMNRKDEVKAIIAEIVSNMTDDDESDNEDEKKDA